jgi:hypothetical protein
MNRTTRRLLPAILIGASFGAVAALVLPADAAPVLSPSAQKAAGAKSGSKPVLNERALLLKAKAAEAGVAKYTCPAEIDVGGSNTSFARGSFAFTGASVSTASCGGSTDLAPANARGGHCMTCSYQNGVTLRRSGGPRTVCWRVPETSNQMACEEVPPLPPSQTCQFEITPPVVDLMPLGDHVGGDDDLWAGGGLFSNFTKATVDVTLERGTGSSSGKLFLQVDAQIQETEPDYTTFRDSKRIEIKTSHLTAGTAADIAACLNNFTANRPFTELTGHAGLVAYEYEPFQLSTDRMARLQVEATCTFDSPGEDIGDVGCNPIEVAPFSVSLR